MKLSKIKTRLDRNQKQWSAKLRRGLSPRFMLRHSKSISKIWANNQMTAYKITKVKQ